MTRPRRWRRIAWLAAFAVPLLCACTDLFHSTDFPTLCEANPSAPACGNDAAPDAKPAPLCATNVESAKKAARQTCAKLSACGAVSGKWNVANCMDDAMLSFDCSANVELAPRGARSEFWSCARDAADCAAVRACLLGTEALPNCSQSARDYASCAGNGLRVLCSAAGGAPIALESCVAQGKRCVDGRCGGGGSACTEGGCDGTSLHVCLTEGTSPPVDIGFDCTLSGDGRCRGAGATSYCGPASRVACTTTSAVQCENGVAVACISGLEQRVRCANLGLPCAGGELTPEGAVSACKGESDCAGDACSGSVVQTCARKSPRSLDCAAEGLGPCVVQAVAGDAFARCTPKR